MNVVVFSGNLKRNVALLNGRLVYDNLTHLDVELFEFTSRFFLLFYNPDHSCLIA